MKKLLWLDDYRNPYDKSIDWLIFSPIGKDVEIIWIKDYNHFIKYISEIGMPDAICFDHDLGDGKNGYDCLNWLIDYCVNKNINLPIIASQSANPVGRENILKKAENYRKFFNGVLG